jgi:type IV pilus assembly protein PilY1
MKRIILYILASFLFFMPLSLIKANAASMNDYCVVPPYVVQDVPPNVMIILDNSGSMFDFAYSDGFNTTTTSDDNDCSNSSSPCTGFLTPGTYPNFKYYGYFDPDEWYAYSSNRFVPAGLKTGSRPGNSWDGNFLNWLTMRRVDIIRKVLTGGAKGTGEGSGYSRLIGTEADVSDRGVYKSIANIENYIDSSIATGTHCVSFSTGSGSSSFTVRSSSSCGSSSAASRNVAVRVPDPVEGVLQNVISTRARLGLTFYNRDDGGFVQVSVAAANLSSVVQQVNNTSPSTNTPLAETLWTVAGYFAQEASISGMASPSGTGPRYHSGDYQTNNNVDPYNYGTGGSPRWPSCGKSYVLLITDGEPCSDGDLPSSLSNYASGRSVFNCSGGSCPAVTAVSPDTYSFPASTLPSCAAGGYTAGLEDVALWAHTTDLRNQGNSPDVGKNDMTGVQNLTLYIVNAFGKGSTLLRYAAINGGFDDLNGNNVPDLQSEWDGNGDGEPDNFYEADEGYAIEQAITNALSTMLKRAASGTAASVLASGEGSGANLVQAIFYPRRRFGNDIIGWTGENQNFWYYVDPFFASSSIREDTVPDKTLNLVDDYIVQMYFDYDSQLTKAKRSKDTDGNGTPDTPEPTVLLENVGSLWKAGQLLWGRDLAADPRTIYTNCNIAGGSCIGSTGLMDFSVANDTVLRPYLQAVDAVDADYTIRYIQGEALTTLYNDDGTVAISGIDRKGNCSATTTTVCTVNADCPGSETCVPDGIDDYRSRYATIGSDTHVWKLGDVLNSTPRLSSWLPLNTYDTTYGDHSYYNFTHSADYLKRGMVFAGGNDGMLHAFKLGTLQLANQIPEGTSWSGQSTVQKARLLNPDTGVACQSSDANPCGKEMWSFIPKNVLPYLKYFADPDYCHIYSVDLTPFVVDASIGSSGAGDVSNQLRPDDGSTWRTIVIVGMNFGGASRATTASCPDVSGDGLKDCVNTPVDVSGSSIGYSSYFALDVTDQNNPQLLWEFSDPQLGFATSGPAVVRVGDSTKNGKWFVVFGSGPTGPIDTTNNQFLGRSDQNLRYFVLNLKNGTKAVTPSIDTGIQYAFSGRLYNTTLDDNLNYADDVIYSGYIKRTGSNPNYTWTDGGVGRLFTFEDPDPSNWRWRTLRNGIGPVTSSIAKLQNNKAKTLWLYTGTGRYFYELETDVDDPTNRRSLLALREPCFDTGPKPPRLDPNLLGDCQSTATGLGGLQDITSISNVPSDAAADAPSFKGWHLDLDVPGNYTYDEQGTSVTKGYRAERVITDPSASTLGLVFFTTYKPYSDECGLGGKSFMWAVKYNTGGSGGALLKGIALLQVSTGSIEQIDLSSGFTHSGDDRKSDTAIEGEPPLPPTPPLLSPPPVNRVIHVKER